MVMRHTGLDGPFGPRPTVPPAFWPMNREEIVTTLMAQGYSRKMAESDADAFLAYRDALQPAPEKDARNDSLSGMSLGERIQRIFGRRAPPGE